MSINQAKPLIIIPTLNEADNIEILIKRILRLNIGCDILVVDGRSEDGTAEKIRRLATWHDNVYLLQQQTRSGYGVALRSGFAYALRKGYDPILTMDGDNCHSPEYIPALLEKAAEYDLVIGSRYLNGVRVEGWKFRKLLLSKLANMYVSYIMVKPIWDFTSGFRCYRSRFLSSVNLNDLHPEAYIIQIQLIHLAFKMQFRVKEIPFVYRELNPGQSKVYMHSKRKTFFFVLKYRAPFLEFFRHLTYLKKDYKRYIDEYDEIINPPKLKNEGKISVKDGYNISIGVMAYNEEKLIENCIYALLSQELSVNRIVEIIIVSSGSTDNTDQIVQKIAKQDLRVKLIVQTQRRGKASAINEFLSAAKGDIVVIESADTVTLPDTVENLVSPFGDAKIGMTGAHPVPVNKRNSFVGFCVNRLWELHHSMALDFPKCGEMIAFRNILSKIPDYTAVDEAAIESILLRHNYKLAYSADAVVMNKGPETLRDFIKQRRRIASGHRHLFSGTGHVVSTQNPHKIFEYILRDQKWNPREIIYMLFLMMIEMSSRVMGIIDFYLRDKNPFIWEISNTTKKM